MKKKLALMFLATALTSSVGSAYAATNLEPIKAFFNRSATFVLNGELWQPKDDKGKPMSAIVYNGANYLPVRALSEALKIPIKYDAASQKVYIGAVPGEKTPIFAMPMEIDNVYAVLSKDPAETKVKDKQYKQVLKIDQYGDITFTIDRQYKKLYLDAAVVDPGEYDVEFSLYNAGEAAGNTASTVLETQSVSPKDAVKRLAFDVAGLDKIKIHVQSHNLNPYIYARIVDTSYFE
ncbi:hypothetical protein I8J29_04355 [Paenibacillus sp. MWE-103]|uniref:Copper amine oxidase-like protein n=1 Tax=Paenibacillus artemisiicola TaxID=1172618 RepID=A0ABS3W548_9BACL|nr:hypothetical protein [Paenibacillus artemisiicola]MBO7743414.1 hypothetical protein [Paenibacillus artemisiicola]